MSSTNKTVKLEDATITQLRAFVVSKLGITPADADTAVALRSLITASNLAKGGMIDDFGDPLLASDKDAPKKAPKIPRAIARENETPQEAAARHEREMNRPVKVSIQPGQQKGDDEPVFASVNGKAMAIPRDGQIYEIPLKYYEALKNAQQGVYDEGGQEGLPKARYSALYPVSFHGFADEQAA